MIRWKRDAVVRDGKVGVYREFMGEDVLFECTPEQADAAVELHNNHDETSWCIYTLSMDDILEVCVQDDIPIPSHDEITEIVTAYRDLCTEHMAEWQWNLANIIRTVREDD